VYEEDDDPEYVPKATRRARKPAQKRLFLVDESYDNQEERLFQQALKNSRIDTCRRRVEVPSAPVYHPTYEEFQDPLAYVSKYVPCSRSVQLSNAVFLRIRSEAAAYGICKIVPPPGWNAPCTIDFSSPKRMPTKLQEIHRLQVKLFLNIQ
jgi:histone demethylase JARID1